jgi:hypothetical protein
VDAENAGVLTPELKQFLDQLMVPLLVERLDNDKGHLYSGEASYYDDEDLPLAA